MRDTPALAAGVVSVTGANQAWVIVVAVIAVLAVGVAFWLRRDVLAASQGTAKMQEIAKAVQEGASAYLSRQFRTLAYFVILVFGILFFLPAIDTGVRVGRSLFFLVGALLSASTGFTGMWLAVRGNVRVAAAAREGGERPAMRIAFRTGGVVGMLTVGLGLVGAAIVVLIYKAQRVRGAGGLRLRRGAAGHVHAGRRRHLHQGRRRRRRPGRQGREGHPGGRPAQRRHDRRQRRRQRRRLRRHGGRPVRVVRRDPGRVADPRQGRVRHPGPDLPADRAGGRRHHRDARHLPGRAPQERPQRHDRDQPRLLRLGHHLAGRRHHHGVRLPAGQVHQADRRHRPLDPRARPATRGWSPSSPCSSASCWPAPSSC